LGLTPDAKATWIEFVNTHCEVTASASEDEAAAESKLEGYAARFALVIHVSRHACGEDVDPSNVDVDSLRAGITLAKWFGREAKRVYSMLRESPEERERRELLDWIERHGGRTTVRELQRNGLRRYRGRAEDSRLALDDLAEAEHGGWHNELTESGKYVATFVLYHGPEDDCDTSPEDGPEAPILDDPSPSPVVVGEYCRGEEDEEREVFEL